MTDPGGRRPSRSRLTHFRGLVSSHIPRLRAQTPVPVTSGDTRRVADVTAEASSALQHLFRGRGEFPYISVYVHGSWADGTRTAFSDLDDLVIIRGMHRRCPGELDRLEKWLNVVDMRFLRQDPLQHHGHWIVHEAELTRLDESYIPLVVLKNAVRLQGPSRVEALVDSYRTRHGLKKNLTETSTAIRRWTDQYTRGHLSLYDAKHLVGALALLPAYVLQLRGEYVGKGEAIDALRESLGTAARQALDWSTEARHEWWRLTTSPRFRIVMLAPYLTTNPHLCRRLIAKASPPLNRGLLPPLHKKAVDEYLMESVRAAYS